MRASVPGSREGLCRKTLASLKSTTLKTLLEPEGDLPPVLPPEAIESHNRVERIIKIRGGGEIYYFGVADRQSQGQPLGVGSLNLSGCAIDEWVELTEQESAWVDSRVRLRKRGVTRQTYGACNPGGPRHHLAIDFGLSPGNDAKPKHVAIRTCSSDNYLLPDDYQEFLRNLTGVRALRYRDGIWAAAEGVVYEAYLEPVHAIAQAGPWKRAIVGLDDGYTNPLAALLMLQDGDGRVHVAREVYRSQLTGPDKRSRVLELGRIAKQDYGLNLEAVVMDPSAAGLRAEFRQASLPAVEADNSVIDGIRRVQDRLVVQGDGRPRLTVHPECMKLREEFGTYTWKQNKSSGIWKDEPVKEHDHAMDALRYGIGYYDNAAGRTRVYRL